MLAGFLCSLDAMPLPASARPVQPDSDLANECSKRTAPECAVMFPIENRMFGVDRLAKRLNALVSNGQIGDWHPGRWVDWGHTSIQIDFDSVEDATLAKHLLSQEEIELEDRFKNMAL